MTHLNRVALTRSVPLALLLVALTPILGELIGQESGPRDDAVKEMAAQIANLSKELEKINLLKRQIASELALAPKADKKQLEARLEKLSQREIEVRHDLSVLREKHAAWEKDRQLLPLRDAFPGLVDIFLDQQEGLNKQLCGLKLVGVQEIEGKKFLKFHQQQGKETAVWLIDPSKIIAVKAPLKKPVRDISHTEAH